MGQERERAVRVIIRRGDEEGDRQRMREVRDKGEFRNTGERV